MDIATILGIIVAITAIMVTMIMDGGSPAELFAHPSAIILIVGGSLGATIITTPLKTAMKLPKFLMKAFTTRKQDAQSTIELLTKLADKARRDGLLALEEDSKKIEDKFLQKGIMMVVDGVDHEQVEAILETNVEQMKARHKQGIGFFAAAGGFAPTFGIIGTVMGLISVLKQLDNPSALGESIAAAFLATLWGLLTSNLIYLPISGKLKANSDEEARDRYMQLEGILAIQAGENPRIVRDKLSAFQAPGDIKGADAGKESAKAPAAAKAWEGTGINMAKRAEEHEEKHDERWLVSYADFITLLMVLFVILYSMGQIDVKKYKTLADSMRSAFTVGGPAEVVDSQINQASGSTSEDGTSKPIVVPGIPEGPTQSEEVAGELTNMLSSQNLGSAVSVQTNIEGVLISLSERLIFQDGQAELPPEAYPVLDTIVGMLRPINNKVRLVGHTSNTPSSSSYYPTNWELSQARAMSVARYMINAGLAPERFIVSGQGEYAPLFPNDTEQHKALNARVEIIIVYPVESNLLNSNSVNIAP